MKTLLFSLIIFGALICYGQEKQNIISQNKQQKVDSLINKIIKEEAKVPKLIMATGTSGLKIVNNLTFEEVLDDTVVHVFYVDKNRAKSHLAIFIDSVFSGGNWSINIDPKDISNINIVKEQVIINSRTYDAKLYVTTKEKKHFDLLSLNQIRNIYLSKSNNSSIFQIDGKIITEDPETYYLDKNFIFKILVTKLVVPDKNIEKNTELDVISILLKTIENFDASKIIYIRGNNNIL